MGSDRKPYYTQEQAARGKDLYQLHCADCHRRDLKGRGHLVPLVGDRFLQRWWSVGDLFSITSMAMPPDNVLGLSTGDFVNITSYLLQQNGFPPGSEPLGRDVNLMKSMVLSQRTTGPRSSDAPIDSGSNASNGVYSLEQAKRGEAFYDSACSFCHTLKPDFVLLPRTAKTGMLVGDDRLLMTVVGDNIARTYRNVGRLYNKLRTSMPGFAPGGLSTRENLDILAYLLQANGLPAGPEELTEDLPRMRATPLLGTGFESLFNGKDFSNFGFLTGYDCTPKPAGCGRAEPGPTFRIDEGVIINSGNPYGFMYTRKKYLDFTLRLEYRFPPYEGMEDDDDFYGNSGYMLFVTDLQVWPKGIELQGLNHEVLKAYTVPLSTTLYPDDKLARRAATKPVGQWNAVEIVSRDGQVKAYLNDVLISSVSNHGFEEPGHILFQAEGTEIQWRNIVIKEEQPVPGVQ